HTTVGPAAIYWRDRDTISGNYHVVAKLSQMKNPAHPEAFGIIIGGKNLADSGQTYTYFLVRPIDGMYSIRRRASYSSRPTVIVDLGCGPGAITELILEHVRDQQPPPHVIGVDPSPSALAKARAAISSKFAEFVQGSAEWLSRLVKSADAVVFLNAIHLMPDKVQVLKEIRRVLKPGGLLAFNSTFFNGAYVEGTSGFWRRWVVRS